MNRVAIFNIVSALITLAVVKCNGQCPSVSNNWECTTDYCYKIAPLTYKNKADAVTYCSGVHANGTLPNFPTLAEFQSFTSLWSSASSTGRQAYLGALAWLGLDPPTDLTARGTAARWTWSNTGSSLTYSSTWASLYPLNLNSFDCAITNVFTSTWTNTLCSALLPVICQIPYNSSYCSTNPCQKCQSGWTEGGSYCYLFDNTKTYNFTNMKTACAAVGATMPELLTVADSAAYGNVTPYILTYLGMTPVNTDNYGNRLGWRWTGANRILSYSTKWGLNQPLNDVYGCAVQRSTDGSYLNTAPCGSLLPLACQTASNSTNCA